MSCHAQKTPKSHQCSPKRRGRVFDAFQDVCQYCGVVAVRVPPSFVKYAGINILTVDRIIPGARGGRYRDDNVTAACLRCNSSKRTRDFIGPVRRLADFNSKVQP
jgi:5-methylcytosine-specific restriction endonuclease McrA